MKKILLQGTRLEIKEQVKKLVQDNFIQLKELYKNKENTQYYEYIVEQDDIIIKECKVEYTTSSGYRVLGWDYDKDCEDREAYSDSIPNYLFDEEKIISFTINRNKGYYNDEYSNEHSLFQKFWLDFKNLGFEIEIERTLETPVTRRINTNTRHKTN